MNRYPSTNPQQEFNRQVHNPDIFQYSYLQFRAIQGKDLFKRTESFQQFLAPLRKDNLLLYEKRNMSPPAQECYGMDDYGNIFYGLNFASADYLGLCTNQDAKEAAAQVAMDYSVNSCGSPLAFGASKFYAQLKEELKDFWGMKEVLIYSAGWLAGFGVIKGLIRPYDFIVMDELCHNCLVEGANAATKNISRTPHLDCQAMEEKVKELREKNPEACILCITEGLFSMDSDYTDLVALQKMTKKYEAFLMIDSAHDFGCMGETGKGVFEIQNLQDFSNVILMSGGSKCLSTNLGWVALDNPCVIDYLKFFSSAYMFTNSINPVQCATALAQLRILRGEAGKRLRKQVIKNYEYVKSNLNSMGYSIIGHPSPIMPLLIGNEMVCRLVTRLMLDEGVHCNGIEYPVVKINQARLRINLQPQHTKEQLDQFIATFDFCFKKATEIYKQTMIAYEEKKGQTAQIRDAERVPIGMNATTSDGFDIKKPNL